MTRSTEESTAAHASQTRVPDFFIVGHPKCGTTALYEMLRSHPQIHMPVKEPWYFASDLAPRSPDGSPRTLEAYLSLFDAARRGQRVGEATPSYLRSRAAASRIAELRPDAHIIAILREPADFLRSFHLQSVQAHIETERNLGKALALEEVRREGKAIPRDCARPEALFYSEHVRYVEQLSRYYAMFPAEQVLVVIYDDFRQENEATVRKVLQFLEVDDRGPVQLAEANPTVRLRSHMLEELLGSLYQGQGTTSRAMKSAVKALTPAQLRRHALRATQRRIIYGKPRSPDAKLMLELRRRFKGEVVALSEYLGRDLVTLWGYDGIC